MNKTVNMLQKSSGRSSDINPHIIHIPFKVTQMYMSARMTHRQHHYYCYYLTPPISDKEIYICFGVPVTNSVDTVVVGMLYLFIITIDVSFCLSHCELVVTKDTEIIFSKYFPASFGLTKNNI